MFVLLYGRKGVFAPLLAHYGFNIVFAFPGGWLAAHHTAVCQRCGRLPGLHTACTCRAARPGPRPRRGRPPVRRRRAGMALAALFVTMPFVVRELLPILEQQDLAEEEAAR